MAIISFIIVYILSKFSEVEMVSNTYTNPIIFIIGAILGIYLCFYVSINIDKINKGRDLSFLGENTIPIICLHFLSFKLVTLIQIYIYNEDIVLLSSFPVLYTRGIWWILYSISGIILPIVFQKVIMKGK